MTFGLSLRFTCGYLFCILFLLTEVQCLPEESDHRRQTTNKLQNIRRATQNNLGNLKKMIDSLTGVSEKITKETELVKDTLDTNPAPGPQSTQRFPLAVALGETVYRNNLRPPENAVKKKETEVEKAQRWRFKLVEGTDKHLKEIFIGKCWDYQNRLRLLRKRVDCNELWDAFVAGFAYKEPCDVTLGDYQYFFSMIEEDPLINKALLWSGTRDITHELSYFNSRFTALEDTFAGYLMDGMRWCGMKQEPGINYEHCPYECAKQKAFWGAAAKKMAERSEGIVYAVVNGTRQHWKDKQIFSAYMMDSYMARNQIPNLDPRKVKEVRIMVGHSLHQNVLEQCGTSSVKELQSQINLRGIKVSCVDDPLSVRALICLDYPRDPLCQFHLTTMVGEK